MTRPAFITSLLALITFPFVKRKKKLSVTPMHELVSKGLLVAHPIGTHDITETYESMVRYGTDGKVKSAKIHFFGKGYYSECIWIYDEYSFRVVLPNQADERAFDLSDDNIRRWYSLPMSLNSLPTEACEFFKSILKFEL